MAAMMAASAVPFFFAYGRDSRRPVATAAVVLIYVAVWALIGFTLDYMMGMMMMPSSLLIAAAALEFDARLQSADRQEEDAPRDEKAALQYRELGKHFFVRYADDCARPKPLLLRDERSPHHKYPKSVSSLGPGATGQPVPSKQDRHNVLEGSAMCGVVRSPGTETNLQAAIAMNDRCAPVSVYPAVIAARAGTGVAEPPVVGRRLLSMVDELGMRTHRGSRGEGGSMQGQSRGVRLETPPGPPMLAVETEDIRPEAEVPTEAWVGSRRGSYERRRRVMPLEQRAPTSVTLAREGRTA